VPRDVIMFSQFGNGFGQVAKFGLGTSLRPSMSRTFASADAESRRERIKALLRLPPEERHRVFLHDYDTFYGGGCAAAEARARVVRAPVSDDLSTLKSTFRFLRSDEDDDVLSHWDAKLARQYYDKLFKEYCVADLSRWRTRKIGMRWRTEGEVKQGKGQFFCGEKKCGAKNDLTSYEVHFGYVEAGEQKEALVKLRVCPACAMKLLEGRGLESPGKEKKEKKEVRDASTADGDGETMKRAKRRRKQPVDDGNAEDAVDANPDNEHAVLHEDTLHNSCFTGMFQ